MSWRWGSHDGISALTQTPDNLLTFFLPSEDTVNRQPLVSQGERELSQENESDSTLILHFPASQTMRNKCWLLKPSSLWYFVIYSKLSWLRHIPISKVSIWGGNVIANYSWTKFEAEFLCGLSFSCRTGSIFKICVFTADSSPQIAPFISLHWVYSTYRY